MDPTLLDRSTSRRAVREARKEVKKQRRERRGTKIDRVIQTLMLAVLGAAVAGGVYWFLKIQLPATGADAVTVTPVPVEPTAGERALAVWQRFASAPDARAKSAFVLDRGRVGPLMEAGYQKNPLPDHKVTPGVPQPLEAGVLAIPSQVAGPPDFLLQIMMRVEEGDYKIDWETYEQEITQRFIQFAGKKNSPAGDFRLVVERAHAFDDGPPDAVYVRIAAPGKPAMARPVIVHARAAAAVKASLPWNSHRRALVRLGWETRPGELPEIVLQEVVRWEFLP
jgi:hypothetical protein